MSDKTVGSTNGPFAVLFRINLIFLPLMVSGLVALSTWLVSEIFTLRAQVQVVEQKLVNFSAEGPRYTPVHAQRDQLVLREEIMEQVEREYPPRWLRDTVESLARRVESLERKE